MTKLQECIVKTEADVKAHFDWHDQEKERVFKIRHDFDGDYDSEEFKKIKAEYDRNDINFGEFDLFYDKIVMYYAHEGDVISNVQYCPFCGIKFTVVRS